MRRFEEYLVEKLREPDFAEAFYTELEADLQNGAADARVVANAFNSVFAGALTDKGMLESSVARQIILLRTLRGLTQDHLAALARARPSSISRLERGATKPSVAFLERIADALDADLEIRIVPRRSVN